ncbi:holin family protein [Porticoccaceae bacterium]|nr:holin family protein [Porticoccaceae bacterium]
MILGSILKIGESIIDRVVPDKNARKAAKEKLAELNQSGELDLMKGQIEINKVEAAHKSLFVAGWRPFVGWVCGVGLAYNVLINPVASIWVAMPVVDPALLYPVLMGMLGMGGLRTWEKAKGVQRDN